MWQRGLACTLVLALAACGNSAPTSSGLPAVGTGTATLAEPVLAQCVAKSPYLKVGEGLDAPGRLEFDVSAGPQPAGACKGNTQFRFGSGLYDIKVEKSFVEDRVNLASKLLLTEGKDKAFAVFKDSASPFVFLDTYIFVLNEQGDTLVDPAFPTLSGRHMLDFKDITGFQPIP